MSAVVEKAGAKVNLTLTVRGVRSDGYHELESLVAFASVGDVVTVSGQGQSPVTVVGPFAGHIQGPNIVERVLSRVKDVAPQHRVGAVLVDKQIPVAAGLGGGSADAGALLRAIGQLNRDMINQVDFGPIAAELGADVPVCWKSQACWMTGIGHAIAELTHPLPELHCVLANPNVSVPENKTADVFRALAASPLAVDYSPPNLPDVRTRTSLLEVMRARGNDLAEAAVQTVPELHEVLSALRSLDGAEYVSVSGAGPTAFAVFPHADASNAAARALRAAHAAWWVRPVVVS